MQSLIEAAQQMGFNQAEAELLAYQTFKGAVELFNQNDYSCEEWIARVMSKGVLQKQRSKSLKSKNQRWFYKRGQRSIGASHRA